MNYQEATQLLRARLDEGVVDALEVLFPNKLPTSTLDYTEKTIAEQIGQQHVINTLRGIIKQRANQPPPK